ncbi:NAD(P)-binding protein [Thozetella sp. PMI_491]|nr:NAD(P)-binding protein [Thozetella sp. PMI_491]
MGALPKDWAVRAVQFTRNVYTAVYPAIDPTSEGNSLKGKTVVLTGASRGIGAHSIAPAFVKAGVKAIVLIAKNLTKLTIVKEHLKAINPEVEVLCLAVDIASTDQVNKAWSEINVKYKTVDILINNAGIESTDSNKTHEQDTDVFFKNYEVNVKGTHSMTQQYLKAAIPWATANAPAIIINISSGSAWGTWPDLAGYTGSKLAMMQYTTTVAASYPGTVLIIAINPGMNDTEIIPAGLRAAGLDWNDFSLTGGNLVWLVANPARSMFLNGRMISVEWDVDELVARAEEIKSKNLLTMQFNATLGPEQFEN